MKISYPNESVEYRQARDALALEEHELVKRVKAVAEQRRKLPQGGRWKEDYTFTWATDKQLGEPVGFDELFGDKCSLILYSFMFGLSWDNPCPSCTSVVDGFDRMAYQVGQDAAFVVVGKAPADRINESANKRGWKQTDLVSGYESSYQVDYGCESESDGRQHAKINVSKKVDGAIFHFWRSEIPANDIDMVWPYWNLMDLTPAGRPNRESPPQDFRSKYLEENY
ncbi:MAG: putative dithiol-disulfide oxidoreductase (DUF899 family) [Granulosicoccus sp.]|jgi:predicted dithiol-disulfide oxidoreductase (DUF899 family)